MSDQLSSPRTPPHDRAIGIEVECLLSYDLYSETKLFEGFFFTSNDYSIDSQVGFRSVEFVSQPLTEQWLKRELYKLYSKFPWEWNDTCGIHVHVSRKWCGEKRGRAIAKFLTRLNNLDMEVLFGRQPNRYCMNSNGNNKFQSVNFNKHSTIEFRMFSSGDAKWAAYCVGMAAYLVKNAHHLNYDAMVAFRDLHFKG